MAFTEIPILDFAEARSEDTKPGFVKQLRSALLNVGFLYIKNVGIDQDLYDRVCSEGIKFFDIPQDEKLRIEMKNKPSFLGYSRLGNEITAHKADWREQMDISTPKPARKETDPIYYNLHGPNQWPQEELLPGFMDLYDDYMRRMSEVSMTFMGYIAESH